MLELNLSQNTNSTLQANGYNPMGKYYAKIQSNIAAQQFAVGAVKVIMQATGETTKDSTSNKAKMTFTSKAKELIKSKTGADATDGEGTATSGDDDNSGGFEMGS